jgi:hypothetical protein
VVRQTAHHLAPRLSATARSRWRCAGTSGSADRTISVTRSALGGSIRSRWQRASRSPSRGPGPLGARTRPRARRASRPACPRRRHCNRESGVTADLASVPLSRPAVVVVRGGRGPCCAAGPPRESLTPLCWVPWPVVIDLARQLVVADPSVLKRYTEREKTPLEHSGEIRRTSAAATSPHRSRGCASSRPPGRGPGRSGRPGCSTRRPRGYAPGVCSCQGWRAGPAGHRGASGGK